MNNSSTGGYLAPAVDAPPAEDGVLDDLLRDLIAGVTALPTDLVRPHWQSAIVSQPEPSIDWCAFGVYEQQSDASPAIQHDGIGDGYDIYIRHQTIDVMCTFYGPRAKGYAQRFADGLAIPQNIEPLQRQDMAFVGVGAVRAVSGLVNQQWVQRYDMTVTLRRKITRTYAVLNLKSATVATTTDASTLVAGISNIHS